MKKRNRSNSGDGEEGEDAAAERAAAAAVAAPKGAFNNPFAAALKSHPVIAGAPPLPASENKPGAETKRVPGPAKAVIRMERKGHGGKEVTVVEQLGLNERELERWMKQLKSSLGCGGSIDGGSILLQGDHRERLKTLLAERGVKKISVG